MPHHIIYARSYGTVVATHLAELLEKESVNKPESLILEGVLGKHWNGWYESSLATVQELADRTKLSDYLRPVELDLTETQWGNYLHDAVIDPVQVFQMREKLKKLAENPTAE